MFHSAIKYIISLFLLATVFWACEPCDECGPQDAYPYFNLSILNKTSLDTLNQYRTRINTDLQQINTALNDPTNAAVADSLNTIKAVKTDSLNLINGLIAITNSRLISIESVNGQIDLFKNKNDGDSLTKFKIPINTADTITFYEIKIEFADLPNQLSISYEIIDSVINDKITSAIKGLKVMDHSFDSLRPPFGCTPTSKCISNQLEIYVEI